MKLTENQKIVATYIKDRKWIELKTLHKGAKIDLDFTLESGETPLTYCIKHGAGTGARFLLEFGADVNLKDSKGVYPLLQASGTSTFIMHDIINAKPNYKVTDNGKNNVLLSAISANYVAIAIQLLDANTGIDINAKNKRGYDAMYMALVLEQKDTVKKLLTLNANIPKNYEEIITTNNGKSKTVDNIIKQIKTYLGKKKVGKFADLLR